MYIFSKIKLGVKPNINALATILIGLVAMGVVSAAVLLRWQQKFRKNP
jgi:putrescine transport system permease protein